jgi:hypothetical protein
MLPPGGLNWQLIHPNYVSKKLIAETTFWPLTNFDQTDIISTTIFTPDVEAIKPFYSRNLLIFIIS